MKRLADRLASPPPTARLGYSSSPVVLSSASRTQSITTSSGEDRVLSLGEQLVEQLPSECVQTIKGLTGHCLSRAGGLFQAVFVIKVGSVKTEYVLPNGQYQILKFLYPGDFFGSDGIAKGFYCFDQMALTDTIIHRIPFSALNQQMSSNPTTQLLYEQLMSQFMIRTQDHVFSLGKHSTEQKLAFFLLDFQDRHPSYSKTLRLPMGREDLASYLGVTIESLSRAFSFLERNQLVQVSNRLLTELNTDGLVQLLA